MIQRNNWALEFGF